MRQKLVLDKEKESLLEVFGISHELFETQHQQLLSQIGMVIAVKEDFDLSDSERLTLCLGIVAIEGSIVFNSLKPIIPEVEDLADLVKFLYYGKHSDLDLVNLTASILKGQNE
jgi:hypothetical protein